MKCVSHLKSMILYNIKFWHTLTQLKIPFKSMSDSLFIFMNMCKSLEI